MVLLVVLVVPDRAAYVLQQFLVFLWISFDLKREMTREKNGKYYKNGILQINLIFYGTFSITN